MNLIKTFEDRMNSVFGAGATGVTSPFSLKKLARRAAKEMEAETFDIDGIATAPALYTILVSAQDDANIRSLYLRLIQEISSFIEAKAQSKSYVFTGKPLIRFMVDPGLKSGKFAVFAENVDAFTLSRLRAEEDAFFQGSLGLGGAAGEQLENSRAQEPIPSATGAGADASLEDTGSQQHAAYDSSNALADGRFAKALADPAIGSDAFPLASNAPDTDSQEMNATPYAAGSAEAQAAQAANAANVAEDAAQDDSQNADRPRLKPTPRAAKHRGGREVAAAAGAAAGASLREGGTAAAQAESFNSAFSFVPAGPKQNEIPAAAPASFYRRGVVPIPDETSAGDFAPLVGNQTYDASSGLDVIPGDYPGDYPLASSQAFAPELSGRNNSPHVPLVNLRANTRARRPEPARPYPTAPADAGVHCLLIDRQTGETFDVAAPSAIIGRERASAQVVLRDPNVSRNHAELVFDGRTWSIHDLGSTNGTQVNNLMVDASVLHDGDIITVALTNLEFRES